MNLQDIYVAGLALLTLFAIGLNLTLPQIRDALSAHPVATGLAALINLVILPLIVVGAQALVPMPEPVFAGLLLCAASPGGGTGSLLTHLAGGNVPFSVGLLVLLTALSLVATPLSMVSFAPPITGVSPLAATWPMVRTLLVFILLPLAMGMALRSMRPALALRWHAPAARASTVLLVLLVLVYAVMKGRYVLSLGYVMPAVAALLVLLSLASSLVVARGRAGLRRAFGLTTAVRSVTMAILLASTMYTDDRTILAVLLFGLIMYLVTLPVAYLVRRQ